MRTETARSCAHVNTCRHRGTRLVVRAGRGEGAALPLPRLDLPPRRSARRRPGGPHHPVPRQVQALACSRRRSEVFCGLVFVNLDLDAEPLAPQLEGIRPLLERYLGGRDGAVRRLPHPRRRPRPTAAVELEGRRRQLPRGLPRAGRAPGSDAAAGLQALRVEAASIYALYDAPLRDKPSDNWAERMYQRLVRPMPGLRQGGRAGLPLHRDLPEHRDRPLPRPRADLEDEPARRRPDRRARAPTCAGRTATPAPAPRSGSTSTSARSPRTRTRTWSGGCSAGLSNTDFTPGPLSLREKGVAWFAGRSATTSAT